jgi:hypothetical protein
MSIFADRVKETATTTGTGDFTLDGAVTGYRTFNAAQGTNVWFDYCIEAVDGSGVPSGDWEVGQGYLSASTTMVRNRVWASSNAGALVNFSAGTKNVFITYAAQRGFTQGQACARAFGLEMS